MNISALMTIMQPGLLSLPKKWAYSEDSWWATVAFVESLVWRIDDVAFTSICELAFYFYKQCSCTIPTVLEYSRGHFISIADWLRHFLRVARKQGVHICPPQGHFAARKSSYNGLFFPYGTFKGCRVGASRASLRGLAMFCVALPNGGKTASDWNRPLSQV